MQRVAIIGEGPAALSAVERLLSAGMCVDLISEKTAPFGLLRRFAGLAGVVDEAVPHECAPGTTPRLRLLGNVRVGVGGDITHNEVHQLAAHGDRELIVMELKARGIPVTTWEGLCTPITDFEDWTSVIARAQLAHVLVQVRPYGQVPKYKNRSPHLRPPDMLAG